jgi:hypothetical protein
MRRDATQWFSDQRTADEFQRSGSTSWLALDQLTGS